jgi:hypothetical protein
MLKYIFILPISLLLCTKSFAQFEIGIHINPTFPMNEFRDKNPGLTLWGFNIEGLYQLPNTPLKVGFGTGYSLYGSKLEKERYLISAQNTMRVRRNNNLWSTNLILRLDPVVNGPIRPYIQGLAGLNYFYTRVKVRPRPGSEVWDAETEFNHGAFFYGGGFGLKYPIPQTMISIDLRADYLIGSNAKYLTKGDAGYDPIAEAYTINPRRSTTDMLRAQIGINILLD